MQAKLHVETTTGTTKRGSHTSWARWRKLVGAIRKKKLATHLMLFSQYNIHLIAGHSTIASYEANCKCFGVILSVT